MIREIKKKAFSLNFQSNYCPIPQSVLEFASRAIYLMECAEIVVPINALIFKGHFTCNCNENQYCKSFISDKKLAL